MKRDDAIEVWNRLEEAGLVVSLEHRVGAPASRYVVEISPGVLSADELRLVADQADKHEAEVAIALGSVTIR
jgi:hypothetical protein